ncbi:MAG: glycosyltransferase family 9 protein, partial [Thermoanaerobaculia bacterium]
AAHLAAAGVEPAARPVILAPGAAWSWTKRWPPETFGGLARGLLSEGSAVVIVIGPGEEELARRVNEAAGVPLPVLGAALDPLELAALLSLGSVVVGNDSGPLHLAAAAGAPVVALFGPTDPGRTAPLGSTGRVLDRYVFCSPCFLKECPYGHECLRGISAEDALRALRELADRVPDPSLRSG